MKLCLHVRVCEHVGKPVVISCSDVGTMGAARVLQNLLLCHFIFLVYISNDVGIEQYKQSVHLISNLSMLKE